MVRVKDSQARSRRREKKRKAMRKKKRRRGDLKTLSKIKASLLWDRLYTTVDRFGGSKKSELSRTDLTSAPALNDFCKKHWDDLETNGDNVISPEEWSTFGDNLIDTIGYKEFRDVVCEIVYDSKIDCDDLIAAAKAKAVHLSGIENVPEKVLIERMFSELDVDTSGCISKEELWQSDFAATLSPYWDELSTMDGAESDFEKARITPDEMHGWFATISKKHGKARMREVIQDLLFDADRNVSDLIEIYKLQKELAKEKMKSKTTIAKRGQEDGCAANCIIM
eukprot:g395.t1